MYFCGYFRISASLSVVDQTKRTGHVQGTLGVDCGSQGGWGGGDRLLVAHLFSAVPRCREFAGW